MRSESMLLKAPYVEKTFKIVRGELKGLVLDVGCGDGILTRTHKNTIGLDNFEELYLSRYKLMDKKFLIPIVRGDMHNLPFKSNRFDHVVINHVLEHSEHPLSVLNDIHRVLKSKGKLIIGVPNSGSLQSCLLKFLVGSDSYAYVKEHKNFFDVLSLTLIIRKKFNIKKNLWNCFSYSSYRKIL